MSLCTQFLVFSLNFKKLFMCVCVCMHLEERQLLRVRLTLLLGIQIRSSPAETSFQFPVLILNPAFPTQS